MANVFTRKHGHPRTTTLLDFRDIDVSNVPQARILSPTRLVNPHPVGLNHQNIPSTSNYLIWHPDMPRKSLRYPKMTKHIGLVNFSCQHPNEFQYAKTSEHVFPKIQFTENTESRVRFIDPVRYAALKPDYSLSRLAGKPDGGKAVTGIVPNLAVPKYLPVIEK